jgi:hypothetical protein
LFPGTVPTDEYALLTWNDNKFLMASLMLFTRLVHNGLLRVRKVTQEEVTRTEKIIERCAYVVSGGVKPGSIPANIGAMTKAFKYTKSIEHQQLIDNIISTCANAAVFLETMGYPCPLVFGLPGAEDHDRQLEETFMRERREYGYWYTYARVMHAAKTLHALSHNEITETVAARWMSDMCDRRSVQDEWYNRSPEWRFYSLFNTPPPLSSTFRNLFGIPSPGIVTDKEVFQGMAGMNRTKILRASLVLAYAQGGNWTDDVRRAAEALVLLFAHLQTITAVSEEPSEESYRQDGERLLVQRINISSAVRTKLSALANKSDWWGSLDPIGVAAGSIGFVNNIAL